MPMIASLATRELALDVVLVALDLLGLFVGARLLGRRGMEDSGFLRDAALIVGFGVAWTLATTLLVYLGLHTRFGAMRAATHAVVFVTAPLAIGRGVLRCLGGSVGSGVVGIAGGLVVAAIYAWAHLVEPYRLEVTTHRIATPRAARLARPVTVALVADVQTDRVGDWEQHVFRVVADARPDLILFAGDYVQRADRERFREECAKFRAAVERIEPWPPLGVLAVIGDVDPDRTIFSGTRVRLLEDEAVIAGAGLQVVGLTLASSRRPFDEALRARIEAFDGYSIVLGHAPDYSIPVIANRIRTEALLVAGHTHGGQIVVPGFGPPMTLSRVPRRIAAGGMHEFGEARVCVSRGTGMERGMAPRVRLFCPPQLVFFQIGPSVGGD
ncbi:MAG: metallophosphoesterase [Planctomycetes bacterium]|nr:metallophosphoesterase [Planctomycetota bacterium]